MRPRVDWMVDRDVSILEFLHETGLALPPRTLQYNLETRRGRTISYSTVNRRLSKLEKAELVEKEYEHGGYYGITPKGRKYLAGELDSEDLELDD